MERQLYPPCGLCRAQESRYVLMMGDGSSIDACPECMQGLRKVERALPEQEAGHPVDDLEWRQELLYQRFATWEPKHTVPTVKELERIEQRERVGRALNAWASRYWEERLARPSFFASFVSAPESGEDQRR